ncbi:MAG: endonuclease III [Actinobacteria bacterium]|nr:endonuclease III [Actinomycetota bacterium]
MTPTEAPTAAERRRLRSILRGLRARFGPLEPPRRTDPLEELILTVLSQHTSDANAERAYGALRARYPTWEKVARARTAALADAIRSGGLANTKAPRIQAILREIFRREGRYDLSWTRDAGDERVREYLVSLPGVGPKTAAVVLAFALGRDAIPVDTHVHRVSTRLGLVPPKTSADKADRLLHDLVPAPIRIELHVGLIRLGREICKAGRPRCESCPLNDLCLTAPLYMGRAAP